MYTRSFSCFCKRTSIGVQGEAAPPGRLRRVLAAFSGTAAAVYQFATPQCVRRTLPELSRSRGFKQAERFAFCPSGQKCPHAHAVSVSSCRLGLSPRLILQTTYRPREKPPGAFSLCSEELSASRPAAASSAHLRRLVRGLARFAGKRAHKLFEPP